MQTRPRGQLPAGAPAQLYGLDILKPAIHTEKDNTTRFVIVGKDGTPRPDADKVSVVFTLDDRVGTLSELLRYFAKANINMKKIESRPRKGHPFEYIFYVDFEGQMQDDVEQATLAQVKQTVSLFRVLGAYRNRMGEETE